MSKPTSENTIKHSNYLLKYLMDNTEGPQESIIIINIVLAYIIEHTDNDSIELANSQGEHLKKILKLYNLGINQYDNPKP